MVNCFFLLPPFKISHVVWSRGKRVDFKSNGMDENPDSHFLALISENYLMSDNSIKV